MGCSVRVCVWDGKTSDERGLIDTATGRVTAQCTESM